MTFDVLTKTKTVENLLGTVSVFNVFSPWLVFLSHNYHVVNCTFTIIFLFPQLKGSGPQTFVTWLVEVFELGYVEGSTDSESQ